MNDGYVICPIAHVRSDFREKFGIPKQNGLVPELTQRIVIDPEFANLDAIRELDGFSHIWLIWGFSGNAVDMTADPVKWSPTVRPPRLESGRRVGVWASRSPYRPNSLGLSSVRLEGIELGGRRLDRIDGASYVREELALIVSGGDLLDGTPVFDIKPYLPFSDSHPDALSGYSTGRRDPHLEVVFPDDLLERIDEPRRAGLLKVLSLDPRGSYEKKDGYTYGMSFGEWDIRFMVEGNRLTVRDVIDDNE